MISPVASPIWGRRQVSYLPSKAVLALSTRGDISVARVLQKPECIREECDEIGERFLTLVLVFYVKKQGLPFVLFLALEKKMCGNLLKESLGSLNSPGLDLGKVSLQALYFWRRH